MSNVQMEENLEKNIVDLTRDIAFKKVFTQEKYLWYLAFVISYLEGLDYFYVLNNIRFKHTFAGTDNMNARTGDADIVVNIDNLMVDVEMQQAVNKVSVRKNNWYLDTMATAYVEPSTIAKDNTIHLQIILSLKPRVSSNPIPKYTVLSTIQELGVIDVFNHKKIIDYNLAYLRDFLYNKEELSKEEKRFLIFIERDKEKLLEIYEEDEDMTNLVNDVSKLKDDKEFIIEYDRAAYEKALYREDGAYEANVETAKNFLKMGVNTIEQIASATGLSIEEIGELQKELEN